MVLSPSCAAAPPATHSANAAKIARLMSINQPFHTLTKPMREHETKRNVA
jgi:hypothetical protein